MTYHNNFTFVSDSQRFSFFALAAFWIFGLLFGAYISLSYVELSSQAVSLMIGGKLMLAGLLCTQLLPFVLSYFAAYNFRRFLLFPIALLKAFLFSYFACGLMTTFRSAGWLLLSVLMLCDWLSLLLLWFVWLRLIFRPPDRLLPCFIYVFAILCLLCPVCVYVAEQFSAGFL